MSLLTTYRKNRMIKKVERAISKEKKAPVGWCNYLDTLFNGSQTDYANVMTVLTEVKMLLREEGIPFAFIGVGSVVRGHKDYVDCKDIDIVVLPLYEKDVAKFHHCMEDFLGDYPHTVQQADGTFYRIWKTYPHHFYNISHVYDIVFPHGKLIQIFLREKTINTTLLRQIYWDSHNEIGNYFSYVIFY